MEPPVIQKMNKQLKKKYGQKALNYAMTIGIEQTPKGRIWNCFVGGGDNADAYFLLNWSDNGGKTWTDIQYVIDPHRADLPFKRRTIVGQLWTDPLGRLWLFMDQSMTYYDGRNGNWYAVCENPDAKHPVWSKPKRLADGCTLNKPTVMSTGEWVLPVSLWARKMINVAREPEWTQSPLIDAHHELDSLRGAHAYVSTDQGRSWQDRGMTVFPHTSFDEHQFVELQNHDWWMTARTNDGIYSSYSSDRGHTWTQPVKYQPHVSSRHFMRKLRSGRILLIRHGLISHKTKQRLHLMAYLSDDEGKTWSRGMMLDERTNISYPTGFEDKEEYINISYDYERAKCGELYMARFNEQDILAGKVSSKQGFLKRLIFKAGDMKH